MQTMNHRESAGLAGKAAWRGSWAVVTGASSGLGSEFARQLAGLGVHLVLVARRADRLERLAVELHAQAGVEVRVQALDLTEASAADHLFASLEADNIVPEIFINNAGFGCFGAFADTPWERLEAMLELDIVALTRLSHRAIAVMRRAGRGWLLNVASIGAYQATPSYAAYAAAKSYVLLLGEALNHELRGENIAVTTLSPGVTRTEFLAVSGQRETLYQRWVMMEAPAVVAAGLKALAAGKPAVVPGFLNKLSVFLNRLTPRPMLAAVAYRLMKN